MSPYLPDTPRSIEAVLSQANARQALALVRIADLLRPLYSSGNAPGAVSHAYFEAANVLAGADGALQNEITALLVAARCGAPAVMAERIDAVLATLGGAS
jgi:hypothetical protein